MNLGIFSEDIMFCSSLASMCLDNNLSIKFMDFSSNLDFSLNYVIVDLDFSIHLALLKCKEYSDGDYFIFGAISNPTKANILKAKKAGCLMVLTKSNFAANLIDIIAKVK
tara:strand:- start:308 stop:637 length:330 start_codon:yes stop_codon:yes gene_type:complete